MVNQAEGTEQLYVEVPPSLKYLVDEDNRTNKQVVIAALETELGVSTRDSVAVIDRRIKRLERRLEEEKDELRDRRDRLNGIQRELERARDVREEKVETEGGYEDRLDDLLDELEAGETGHLDADHARIDRVREEFDRPNEEIHLDLQQRAAEQGRPLTRGDFMQQRNADLMEPADRNRPISKVWGDSDGD